MVKFDDRVRLTDKCQYLGAHYEYKVGDIGVIINCECQESIAVKMENPKNGYIYLWCNASELEYTEKTPPEKITQNGYEYSLVGPVKPEWLVDGAWVVSRIIGTLYKTTQVDNDRFQAIKGDGFNNSGNLTAEEFSAAYRPHEPKDWK